MKAGTHPWWRAGPTFVGGFLAGMQHRFQPLLVTGLPFEVSPVWQGRPRMLAHLLGLSWGSAGLGGLGKGLFHH